MKKLAWLINYCYNKTLQANLGLQKQTTYTSVLHPTEPEEKTNVQPLSVAKECVINKLDLITNVTVVNGAIRFVTERSKETDNNQGLQQNKMQAEVITNSVFLLKASIMGQVDIIKENLYKFDIYNHGNAI